MRFLLIFLLSGCASAPQFAPVPIVWHKVDGRFSVIGKDGAAATYKGRFQMIDGVCHIWAPDPAIKVVDGKRTYEQGQWGTLGHEVKHCFDGFFHDSLTASGVHRGD